MWQGKKRKRKRKAAAAVVEKAVNDGRKNTHTIG